MPVSFHRGETNTYGERRRRSDGELDSADDDTIPSSAQVITLSQDLRNKYKLRDEMIDLIREERFLQKKPEIPDAFKVTALDIRLPTVNDNIDRLVANLTLNDPQVHCPLPAAGPDAQRRASKLEKAGAAILETLMDNAGKNLVYKAFDSAVESGEMVWKVLYTPHRWDKLPTRKRKEKAKDGDTSEDSYDEEPKAYLSRVKDYKQQHPLPISARVVDRRTFYPEMDEDGYCTILEVSKRTLRSLDQQFPNFRDRISMAGLPFPVDMDGNLDHRSQITLIEYWDRKVCVYLVAEGSTDSVNNYGILRAFKHPYKRVPYFTGFGQETSSPNPNFEGMPSAFPLMYLSQLMDSTMTMFGNVGYLTGFPTITKESPQALAEAAFTENSDEAPEPENMTPGRILQGPPGTKYGVLDYGRSAQALSGMISILREVMQGVSMPTIMQGVPPGDRTAGYAISALASAAKAKYQQIVKNGQRCISDVLNFCLWIIEHLIDAPVELLTTDTNDKGQPYQTYLELRPSDIKGYHNLKVKIQPHSPTDRQTEGMFMSNMVTNRLTSRRRAMEEGLGYEQPDDIIDEILVEEALEDPDVKKFITQKALQQAGLGNLMQDVQAARQLMQMQLQNMVRAATGGPPGGGGPGAMSPGGEVRAPMAPTGSGMEVPGMPAAPGTGMALQDPYGPQLPRQYSMNQVNRPPSAPQQPVAGFQGR